MIRVEGLVKTYRGKQDPSVDGLSLHVGEGEVFAFLGPNGAGKSTTAKILTTLMAPTAGVVEVAGFDVSRQSRQVRENIGYVAQSTGIDFFMTGRENLMLIGHLYHLSGSRLRERVDTMLEYFGLTKVADQVCAGYSGGMQRKLDIATALLHQPKILFLDEPTLGLDAQSRIDLWKYVGNLNSDLGVTVFLTTHYLDEADKLAHRVGIIDAGKLQAIGTPSELKDMLKGDSIALSFEGDVALKARPLLEKASFAKEVLEEEEGLRIYVDNGGETIADLISLLSSADIRVKSVTLARPTLDDVFIKFTGRSMDKVEEKVKPWWAQWAGDNWEQLEAESNWEGNKWVNSDGTPKDEESFKEWAGNQGSGVEGSAAEGDPAWAGNQWVNADGTARDPEAMAKWVQGGGSVGDESEEAAAVDAGSEDAVSEEKENKKTSEGPSGASGGWSGNEWVNADGSPKDPEAMAKWLKDSAGKASE
ncbi:MAG: ATP-binding cassette domain-containing protein [Nitrospirota bacterium]|nr:ATP-binding cassette domain-containing protein [Nitrospirota bacterium]